MKKLISAILFCTILAGMLAGCDLGFGEKAEGYVPNVATLPTQEESAEYQEELELDQYTAFLEPGQTLALNVTGAENVTWASTNEAVVLVNSQGNVTAVAAGVANITCTDQSGRQVSCTVTVAAAASSEAAPSNGNIGAVNTGDIFPHSSNTYLTKAEVVARLASCTGYSPGKGYAQDAINEIYARHGYMFRSEEVRNYYMTKSWYVQNPNFSEADFNEYEKQNIKLLNEF